MKKWLGALVSGCVVYAFMAACSGVGGDPHESELAANEDAGAPGGSSGGGDEAAGSGGSLAGSSGAVDGGGIPDALADVFDALTDPIPDALADAADAGDPDDGSGDRLKAQSYQGADGSSMRLLTMWDSELKTQCMFGLAADGSTRCLPSAFSATSAYSDGNCSVPLFRSATSGTCGQEWEWGYVSSGNCGERRVFKLGAVHPGQVYGGIPGSCIPVSNPCGDAQFNCDLRAGEEMAPDAFVAAELVTG